MWTNLEGSNGLQCNNIENTNIQMHRNEESAQFYINIPTQVLQLD